MELTIAVLVQNLSVVSAPFKRLSARDLFELIVVEVIMSMIMNSFALIASWVMQKGKDTTRVLEVLC